MDIEFYSEKTVSVTDLIFLGSKITVDGDCSHEIKRWFLLERKAMANIVKVFPVVMYRCES